MGNFRYLDNSDLRVVMNPNRRGGVTINASNQGDWGLAFGVFRIRPEFTISESVHAYALHYALEGPR